MNTFDVAYVRIDGTDLILVPVHPRFGIETSGAMRAFVGRAGKLAAAAGLAGEVVPVWDDGDGGLMAFAKTALLPRLARLSWGKVRRLVNVRLHVGTRVVEVRTEQAVEGQVAESLAS
jgi:hypothetical protein